MTAMYNGITEAEYEYGISGLRRSKIVNGKQTRFVYSGADIIGEVTDQNYYIYYRGTELLGSKSYNGNHTFYQQNAHGDVTAITTSSGEERTYDYSPFGEKRALIQQPMGADSILYQWKAETESTYNPFGYCGEYVDAETGFVYLRNRYYSPSIGRFTTEDPVRDGLNWYAYCDNNPIMFVDPSGYSWEECVDGKVIFIDPGHGGSELGATKNYDGEIYYEKDLNLSLAFELKRELEEMGAVVYMSRTTDETVSLDERYKMANEIKADIFISVHHNSCRWPVSYIKKVQPLFIPITTTLKIVKYLQTI